MKDMPEAELLAEFDTLETSSNFISKNFSSWQREYPEKYIAIENSKIVGVESTFEKLFEVLKIKGKKISEVLIEFIPSKDEIIIY